MQVVLSLQLVAGALYGVIAAYTGLQASKEVDVFFEDDGFTMTSFNWIHTVVLVALALLFIITIVLFCIWTNKSMKNAWALRENSYLPTMTPGWAVGFYFIPIVLLWKPFQGMREIWQVTFRDRRDVVLLRWWWGFWLISNFADNIGLRLPVDTFAELAVSSYYDAATSLLSLAAGILLIRIVGQVTAKQMEFFHGNS